MSNSVVSYHPSNVRVSQLWITDEEVRAIFRFTRCYYTRVIGNQKREADGVFIREQRSKEGTLGYVLRDPISGENWLWVISKKTRRPFCLARVG